MTTDELVEKVADQIQERMGPLFGSPEYLADPVKLARAQKRQRDAAETYASIAVEIALTAIQSDLRARHYGECMAFLREGGWVTAADDLADFLAISRGDLTPMEE